MPSVGKNVEQLELLCTVVGVWYSTITLNNSLVFLKNINIHLPYDPDLLLLGIYLRKMKAYVHNCTQMLYSFPL